MFKLVLIIVGALLGLQLLRWLLSRVRDASGFRQLGRGHHRVPDPLDDLIEQMRRHAVSGDFSTRAPLPEDSAIAALVEQYNAVLDAVQRKQRDARRSHANTEQLLRVNAQLRDRVAELAHTNLQAVGREQRLVELQQEVNELAQRLGERPHYDLPVERTAGQMRLRA